MGGSIARPLVEFALMSRRLAVQVASESPTAAAREKLSKRSSVSEAPAQGDEKPRQFLPGGAKLGRGTTFGAARLPRLKSVAR